MLRKTVPFLLLSLVFASPGFAKTATESKATPLRQSYHQIESSYSIAKIFPANESEKATLQNFIIAGEGAVTPEVSLTARLPFVTLAGDVAMTNPSVGFKAAMFEGLLKGFPAFVFMNGNLKVPMSGSNEFVFKRTDISLGISAVREVYHLSLRSDLSYIMKIDSDSAAEKYGNELSATVGGELNTGYQVSLGTGLNYRRATGLQTATEKISGHSVFILKPYFMYHIAPDMLVQGSLATPLGQHKLKETLHVFGDYTVAGLGGNTFFLSFEKKF